MARATGHSDGDSQAFAQNTVRFVAPPTASPAHSLRAKCQVRVLGGRVKRKAPPRACRPIERTARREEGHLDDARRKAEYTGRSALGRRGDQARQ
jgi:hypothetical protein